MKGEFSVEQCTYALFECPQDVNEETKKHTKAVSVEFCVFFLFLEIWFQGFNTFDVLVAGVCN